MTRGRTAATSTLACAAALVLLAIAAAGCVDQTRVANEAIARANEAAQRYRELDSEVAALLDEAAAVDFTPEGVAPAFSLLDQARAKIEERQKVVGEIRETFASIASLRVSDEIKAYAAQQVAIADLLAEVDVAALELIDATRGFYEGVAAKDGASEQAQALAERVLATSDKIERLSESIAAKRAESDAYFEEHLAKGR